MDEPASTILRPDRRQILVWGAGGGALAALGLAGTRAARRHPFTLGVASGDPASDGFVIWTRLAPQPLAPDGRGGIAGAVEVRWQVAADEAMRQVAAQGTAQADDRFAHSVHVEVAGLKPDRPYWYRFQALGERSPVGRARTAPLPGARLQHLRLAMASCSHFEKGFFSAYRHMAEEQPDLVLFLGDYIYEYSERAGRDDARAVRRHDQAEEITDLSGYRRRYAQYKTDPDLQALHGAAPCLMTWDDHEVQNDYANRWSQNPGITEADFLRRRAAAYRAFYEHMPLRRRSIPNGPDMRVYDRLRFGDLAEFTVLDGRQYRSIQPCALPSSRKGHVAPESCTERTDPGRTMLGLEQERWLYDGFNRASTRWTVIAQDLLVAPFLQERDGVVGHFTDGWDGYPANRERMLAALAHSPARNPVFLGGDFHAFWTNDLKADFGDLRSRTIATEFVGTSITSDGPPYEPFMKMMPENPHVKFFDSRVHGYVSIDLAPERMEARLRTISDRRDPRAGVSTLKRYVVEDGKPGAVEI